MRLARPGGRGAGHGGGQATAHGATALPAAGRLLIVSNRLPVTLRHDPEQGLVAVPSSGGLATGLGDVHARGGARWIGWAGLPDTGDAARRAAVARELALRGAVGVPLTAEDVAGYYDRFANGALWPVLHDRPDLACAPPPTGGATRR
jgi:trehalose 6-phosphate synthase/phosphatase